MYIPKPRFSDVKFKVASAIVLTSTPMLAFAQDVPAPSDAKTMLIGALILGIGVLGGWLGTKYMADFIVKARNDNEQNWKDVVVALGDKLYAAYPAPPVEVKK